MNAPTQPPTESEAPVTMRAASKVLQRIAVNLAMGLGVTRDDLEASSERLQQALDEMELQGVMPEDGATPVVLLLAACMLELLAETTAEETPS